MREAGLKNKARVIYFLILSIAGIRIENSKEEKSRGVAINIPGGGGTV